MKQKTKEYKYFNYPNNLTALEQYYYYLLEFGAIPNELPPQLIEKIFVAVAKDYLEGLIDIGIFECIAANLYFNFAVKQVGISPKIDMLMAESSDVTFYGERQLKNLQKNWNKNFLKENFG